MKQKILFSLIMVFVVVSVLNFVSAEMFVSDAGVEYESELIEYFNNQGLVEQIILNKYDTRKDYSRAYPLEIIDNKTWIRITLHLKNISQDDEIFAGLSENEIRNIGISRSVSPRVSGTIGAKISKEGFNRLIGDGRISHIYLGKLIFALFSDRENPIIVSNKYVYLGTSLVMLAICTIIFVIFKIRKRRRKR